MKLLVINGPNINLLGIREPELYGKGTYAELCARLTEYCRSRQIEVRHFQSNHEGAIVDEIQNALLTGCDGLIINPAAYTHTSIAIADALRAVGIPAVEVHLTDIGAREDYRRISYVREVCIASVVGKGFAGYTDAVELLLAHLQGGSSGMPG